MASVVQIVYTDCGLHMANFRFFETAGVRHLGFTKKLILPTRPIWKPNLRHHAKLDTGWSNHWGDMADFLFFKMAAAHYLGFLKVQNFTRRAPSEGQFVSSRQISCRSV